MLMQAPLIQVFYNCRLENNGEQQTQSRRHVSRTHPIRQPHSENIGEQQTQSRHHVSWKPPIRQPHSHRWEGINNIHSSNGIVSKPLLVVIGILKSIGMSVQPSFDYVATRKSSIHLLDLSVEEANFRVRCKLAYHFY